MSSELKVAVRAAEEACDVLLRHLRDGVVAKWKGARDPVSVADLDAEAVIRATVRETFPDDVVVGEEGDQLPEAQVAGTRRWYVDPLDGTVNFLRGRRRWAVSIAFCSERDDIDAAVVAQPLTEEVFTAARGQGALRNGVPIHTSDVTEADEAVVCVGPNAHRVVDIERLWATVLSGRVTGCTSLDLCDVACGRADAHVSAGQGRWDLAAGSLIAAEAGATTLSEDLIATSGPTHGGVVVAGGLLPALRPFLR